MNKIEIERNLKRFLKGKMKFSKSLLISFLITGSLGYGAVSYSSNATIADGTSISDSGSGVSSISIGSNAIVTATNFSITQDGTGGEPVGINATNGSINATGTVDITIAPSSSAGNNVRPKGVIVRSQSDSSIDTLNVDVTLKSAGTSPVGSGGPDSDAAYGVAVGYNSNGGSSTQTASLTVNDATINVTDTSDTVTSIYSRSRWGYGVNVYIGHQLSGIRVYRNGSSSATPTFTSTGNLVINVTDTSGTSDYNVGIYTSGQDAKAVLNNSTITVTGNGVNSAALKIGKPINGDGSSIISNGKMVLDTTGVTDSATVRLFANNSVLDADADTSSAEIKSANSAIVYDTQDYKTVSSTVSTQIYSRNASGDGQTVSLKNAVITTTGTDDSLIRANARRVSDSGNSLVSLAQLFGLLTADQAANFNNGDFNITNAVFNLMGEDSLATTEGKGWAVQVESVPTASTASYTVYGYTESESTSAGVESDLTVNLSDSAVIEGLMHKEAGSDLNVNIDNATWKLRSSEIINLLQDSNQFTVTTGESTTDSDGYTWSVTENSDGTYTLTKVQGSTTYTWTIASDSNGAYITTEGTSTETLKVTKDGDTWTFTHGVTLNDTTTYLTDSNQRSTINNLTITNGGILDAATYTTDGTSTQYFVKLTSDGINNDGTLSNGGIITMANDSYDDVLTIEGNYVGNSGVVKMNTLWNAPGDEAITVAEGGADSESDLLHITGDASGDTVVIPVSIDGTEYVIDGDVTQVLNTVINTVPVVTVTGNSTSTTFTGTAKTTGISEVQLTSRQLSDGSWEYYWTAEAATPTPDPVDPVTPVDPVVIIDPVVPGYLQMPRINAELGYATIGTLHERRGENLIIDWEYYLKEQNPDDQLWIRLFRNSTKNKGKDRYGYNNKIDGVQVGYDFGISKNDKNNYYLTGLYLAYAKGKADFFDENRAVNGIIVDDKKTGKGKAETISLGLTRTKYTEKGSYLDLVGQVSLTDNKFEAINGVTARTKNTFGWALSAEAGKHYILKENVAEQTNWVFEPQAQLIYQGIKSKGFNDGLKEVGYDIYNGFRGRIGFRLAYNDKSIGEYGNKDAKDLKQNTFYAIGNVWHDFAKNKDVRIGSDKVNEKYARTWWELGAGMQLAYGEESNFYADYRYTESFKNSPKHQGHRFTLGIKHTFVEK